MKTETSNCCDALMTHFSINEGRTHYICSNCGKSCNLRAWKASELFEGEKSSLKKTFDAATAPIQNEPPTTLDWEREFDKLEVVYNIIGTDSSVPLMIDDEQSAVIKAFIAQLLDEQKKAYGGCEKCYGKGYHTELTTQTISADFMGDKSQVIRLSNVNPCTCNRGEQIKKVLTMVQAQVVVDQRAEYVQRVEELEPYLDEIDGSIVKVVSKKKVLALFTQKKEDTHAE